VSRLAFGRRQHRLTGRQPTPIRIRTARERVHTASCTATGPGRYDPTSRRLLTRRHPRGDGHECKRYHPCARRPNWHWSLARLSTSKPTCSPERTRTYHANCLGLLTPAPPGPFPGPGRLPHRPHAHPGSYRWRSRPVSFPRAPRGHHVPWRPAVDVAAGRRVITKAFILAKDNYRISARILRDNKILRDHGTFPSATAKRKRPGVKAGVNIKSGGEGGGGVNFEEGGGEVRVRFKSEGEGAGDSRG
jgi:hypothetical protein